MLALPPCRKQPYFSLRLRALGRDSTASSGGMHTKGARKQVSGKCTLLGLGSGVRTKLLPLRVGLLRRHGGDIYVTLLG